MPLTSAFLTCGVKASAADVVAQKTQAAKDRANYEDVSPFQKKRNFAFLMYGGLYQGIAQEIIFNELFPILFGQGTDVLTVASKVLFDSFIVTPLVCLPVAYVVKSVIFQYSLKEAFDRYITDITKNGLLFKYWSIWGPVQCLTFGVVPQHLRIAFIAVVSFFWLIIFSSLTAKSQKERDSVDVDDTCSLEDGMTCKIDG
jgi:protein Mpv17